MADNFGLKIGVDRKKEEPNLCFPDMTTVFSYYDLIILSLKKFFDKIGPYFIFLKWSSMGGAYPFEFEVL